MENMTMTPDEALDILRQATVGYRGTKRDHELFDIALGVLLAVIAPPAPPKE